MEVQQTKPDEEVEVGTGSAAEDKAGGGGPGWLLAGRIPCLDGLRAVAVLLVVLTHAHQTRGFPDWAPLHAVGSIGSIGVEVFFAISGFLITNLMLREMHWTGRLHVKQFYIRRILRIVPAYVALLIAVAILEEGGYAELTRYDWLASVTYTVNFLRHPAWEIGHAWSLSIEEHFYLLWPAVMATAAATLGWRVALACLGFCFIGRWVVLLVFPEFTPMAELWTFTRLDAIAAGCLLAFLAWDPAWRRRLDGVTGRRWVVALTLGIFVGSLILSEKSGKVKVGFGYTVNTLCICVLIWASAAYPGGIWGKIMNHRAVRSVGVVSYSLYLWQQLFLNHERSDWLCMFPQNVLFAFGAAAVSYNLIEKPFLNLKPQLVKKGSDGTNKGS